VTHESSPAESSPASARAAVLAPGGNYGPGGPLLMFGGKAARQRGESLHPATRDLGAEGSHAMVLARVGQVIDGLDVIDGPADDWWDGEVAMAITPHVLEIAGADHGMFVPGPLAASAAVLGEAATAVERFLDDVVWPS
jgi:hypothetical protein